MGRFKPVDKRERLEALKVLNRILTDMDKASDNMIANRQLRSLNTYERQRMTELTRLINSWKFETEGRMMKVQNDIEEQEESHKCKHKYFQIAIGTRNGKRCEHCGETLL